MAATELGTAAAWAHRYPHIKKQGAQESVQLLQYCQYAINA